MKLKKTVAKMIANVSMAMAKKLAVMLQYMVLMSLRNLKNLII